MNVRGWAPKNVFGVAIGMLVAVLIVPFALVARGVICAFGFDERADRSPEEVVDCLRKFIEGTEGEWDIDDFESVEIKDEKLESIRKEFLSIDIPMDEAGRTRCLELLFRAQEMIRARPS